MQKQAIFIMGPTAVGKTALALELAQQLPSDIISVDSAMVYRGMDIGTGKPDHDTLAKIPHALIDILDPAETYSAGKFCTDAYTAMNNSIQQNRTPILVGGTMMYFWALQHGLAKLPDADPVVRARILQEAEQSSWLELHKKLQQLDPIAASRIEPNDVQRIQRALEVITISGEQLSSFAATETLLADWHLKIFILVPEERSILHQRIAERFQQMLAQGFVAEVETLFARGDLHLGLPSIRAVGYRQVWELLQGGITEQQMIEQSIAATRQLAKRQFTWLRRWPDAQHLNMNALQSDLVGTILSTLR